MKKVNPKFIQEMQRRIAQTSIGPSSLRNQGAPGIIDKCRNFCEKLALYKYNPKTFTNQLNKDTRKLLKILKKDEKSWGTARKALNLFLRDAFYNVYLSKKYKLYKVEHLLEIPLDNDVANKINNSKYVQKWKHIKNTSEEDNTKFQDAALKIAKKNKVFKHRVHLDLIFWRSKDK
jgi:hypothetical protein